MQKRALISVFDKSGILDLARYLFENGWEIISTGGTANYLSKNGICLTDVSRVTSFSECLDGRVKTLHPAIHAGLLARRDDVSHMQKIAELDILPIDLVCVNLYPFFEKLQAKLAFAEIIEFIDIGGPAMLRSGAKNFQDVLVLSDPADYPGLIQALKNNTVDFKIRRRLAAKVFNLTSAYDAAVSQFMMNENGQGENELSQYYTVPLIKSQNLRYGENAHQKAALYLRADCKGVFAAMQQLQGKELSYNNIRDLDIAWKAVSAFNRFLKNNEQPVFVIALKHNTPCGAALGANLLEAYIRAYDCDPVSIFGGIIGCSAPVDGIAAEKMIQSFLEAIIAPSFTPEALEIFKAKKNVRLIRASISANETLEYISVDGGLLVQNKDLLNKTTLFENWNIVTRVQPQPSHREEAFFGMLIAAFAKSNAIVAVKGGAAIGIGAGQTNRIWALEQALERAAKFTQKKGIARAELLVSDAFFPFSDCVEKAAEYGIKTIIQPGGSIRDQESIDAADKLGIAMVFTGTRHFKH